MRIHSTMLAAIAAVSATGASAQPPEIGYPRGALAAEAIAAADYARAEAQLRNEFRIPDDDPARLINFGHVLAKTGRLADAARMFEEAAAAEDVELILKDGRIIGSREAARRALMTVSVGGPAESER